LKSLVKVVTKSRRKKLEMLWARIDRGERTCCAEKERERETHTNELATAMGERMSSLPRSSRASFDLQVWTQIEKGAGRGDRVQGREETRS
jgi:hypothetical protein